MTKKESKPRRNPLATPGRQDIDPNVRAVIKAASIKRGDFEKVTYRLPVALAERIRQIAEKEAGSMKAVSEAASVLLEQGVADYDEGRLTFKTKPVVMRQGLVRGR